MPFTSLPNVFPRTFLKEGGIVFGKKGTTVPGMAV